MDTPRDTGSETALNINSVAKIRRKLRLFGGRLKWVTFSFNHVFLYIPILGLKFTNEAEKLTSDFSFHILKRLTDFRYGFGTES